MKSESEKNDKELELLKSKVELLEKELEMRKDDKDSKSKKPTDEEEYKTSKVLYTWEAPIRVFVKRERKWFLTIGIIALILIFFLILVDKPLLIAVILATVFLVYVLATTKPDLLKHEITNKGIYTLKKLYRWTDITSYWFVEINGQELLYVNTKEKYTPRLIMLVGNGSIKELNEEMQKHTPYNYLEKQSRIGKYFDGVYIPADKLPGKVPATNRIEK